MNRLAKTVNIGPIHKHAQKDACSAQHDTGGKINSSNNSREEQLG